MSDLEQVRSYLTELKNNPDGKAAAELELAKTHLMELWMLMREGLGELASIDDVRYSTDGFFVRLRFADWKTYEIEIKEGPK